MSDAVSPPLPSPDDRTRAATELAGDLAVTAGAGAGKTTVLVDRFVTIARHPRLGPDRVLAITFTKKAAVEMKERAIRVFDRSGEVELRRQTEAAYISTIHGFAERILRERPFDARIDPAFSVLTEYDQALFLQDALQTMYARAELRAFAPRLGKTFDRGWRIFALVPEVARLLREGPEAARREVEALACGDDACVAQALERARSHTGQAEARMLDCLQALQPLLAGASFRSRGAKYQAWQAYLAAVAGCLDGGTVTAADTAVWRATSFTSEIQAEERAPIRALLDRVKALAPTATYDDWDAQEALERELLPLKRVIYDAAAEIGQVYASHKRHLGALDFHDLQQRAADLLRSHEAVRAEYAERFRHILLDESQDTDELQYGIIRSLRAAGNTLFMVGDPKQAIYEFRGADPDVFHAAVSALPADRRLQLPENFRSRAEIVSFVNGIGPALLGDQFVKIHGCADYGKQVLDAAAVTAIWALHAQTSGEGERRRYEPVTAVRPREAAAVADEIVRLLRERPLVRDPHSREVAWVPLRPGHVALLFRTRTAIPYFERALAQRGVPYVTAAGQGFYERAEVLDCLTLLRAVAQPLDDLAMAALLRSPFVGAGDGDLWRLRAPTAMAAGERPRALWHAMRGYEPLTGFRERFHALRRRSRGRCAGEVLEDALRTFGYEAALAAHEDGPAMLANLAKLRRQLREFGALSPLEAYTELERTRELLTSEAMAPLVGPADDVVVLTTIHQAKGLEWPVVCLPNLQGKAAGVRGSFSARHGALLLDAMDAAGEPMSPLSLAGITEELSRRGEAEERRLLYVALTRARERLVLSASVPPEQLEASESEKFGAPLPFLLHHTQGTLADPGEHDCGSYRTCVRHVTDAHAELTHYQGDPPLAATFMPAEVVIAPDPAPPLVVLPRSLKVTELLSYRRCPQVHRLGHLLEIEENVPRRAVRRGQEHHALTPVELGTRVHALLERARFEAPDVEAEMDRLLADEPQPYHAALRRMLRPVLDGDVGVAVRAARRVEREWQFATEIGGVLVEGVIDLAIQAPDGAWTVVDYKSNDFSRKGRLEYLIDYYAPQLELYALALSRAGLGAVDGCALVFLAGPVVHRWGFHGAAESIDRWSRDTVARIAARDYSTAAGPKCELCGYRKRKVCGIGRGWTPSELGGAGAALASEPES